VRGWNVLPDGLVRDDNLGPVLDLVCDSLELRSDMADRLAPLPLLEALAAAQDHAKTAVERSLGLARDKVVVLLENDTTLRVAENRP
jgi:hypothetical protein